MVEDYAILRDLPSVTNYARQCVSCIRLNIAHPSIVAVCADNLALTEIVGACHDLTGLSSV